MPGQVHAGEAELIYGLITRVPGAHVVGRRAREDDAVRGDDLEPHAGDLPGEHRECNFGRPRGIADLVDPDDGETSAVLAVIATKTDERSWDAPAAAGWSSAIRAAATPTIAVGQMRRLRLMG